MAKNCKGQGNLSAKKPLEGMTRRELIKEVQLIRAKLMLSRKRYKQALRMLDDNLKKLKKVEDAEDMMVEATLEDRKAENLVALKAQRRMSQ
jgi:hypothetical protein